MLEKTECGVAKAMTILGGKWRLNILWALAQDGPLRFNTLKRKVTGVTNIMLTRSLDALIQSKLVTKKDYHSIPPHTEYSLTNRGKELVPFLQNLDNWGRENL